MKIKVLGAGCPKCKKLYAEAEKAVAASGVAAELEKVEAICTACFNRAVAERMGIEIDQALTGSSSWSNDSGAVAPPVRMSAPR